MVGGFALQKVTEERSYFRTIANVDIKLDIVPPSLINFISRQLIGSGFRIYQKTIASISKGDKNFGKALIDPLYKQIHEGIYSKGNPERDLETGIVQGDTCTDSEEHNQTAENKLQSKGQPNQGTGSTSTPTSLKYEPAIDWKASTEIEEVRFHECKGAEQDAAWKIAEENNRSTNQPNDHDFEGPSNFNNEKAHLSLPVEQALGTLEKAISMIRDVRLNTQAWAESGVFNKETSPRMEGNEPKPSTVEDCWTSSYKEAPSNLSQGRTVGRTSQQLKNSFNLKNSRHGLSSFSEEVNPLKIAPASPKKSVSTESDRSLQVASHFIENGPAEAAVPGKTIDDGSKIITDDDDIHDDRSIEQKESQQRKKWKLCCFLTG
ncbi:hypothetical protein Nepgr_024823 [Nepenthes gracilis]|uniref:Uncharacterized protein n=1 Tax=Nepenthes gracilis TaxID=150966 RepID=A0AAD3Y0G2_NEPGR|nr:hypothetical protein Nepgr_024823 [Nepenthes gracilis]